MEREHDHRAERSYGLPYQYPGWLFSFFGGGEVVGMNWMSLVIAVVGAVAVLAIVNLISDRKKRGNP